MCCGNEEGSYLRRTDSCIIQIEAQETSRTFNESKEEEKKRPRVEREVEPAAIGVLTRNLRLRG